MSDMNRNASGEFSILGQRTVNRLGFGAMRITGPGIWGPPADLGSARETLRRAASLGVDFFDTADSYGPFVSEELIRECLHPYKDILVATKGGFTRQGPDRWAPVGRPEYLRQCVLMSLRRLGLDRIDLWYLHRIDSLVPRDEQFDAIAQMQKEGLIAMLGLSEVSVHDIEAAQRFFRVATVQNRHNLFTRRSEDVLDFCERHDIGFIPWFPLSAGRLAEQPNSALATISRRLGATASQVALAWLLARSRVMLPIPGTSRPDHLEQNVAAATLRLSTEDFEWLDREGRSVGEGGQG
jgi:pyridoxine 4-dehydrogenase